MAQKPERKFYLQHFRAISHAISTYEDLNVLTNHLAEGTSRRFKAKGCSIMLIDERDNQLHPISSYGLSQEYLSKGPIVMDDKHGAIHKGEPVFVVNMQNDPHVQYPEAAANEGIVSMLSIPIKYHDTVIGLIRIYHDEPRLIHDEDINTLGVMAEHLGLVIENNGLKNFLDGVKNALESLPPRMLKDLQSVGSRQFKDTTNFFAIDHGDEILIGGKRYMVTGFARETRFGLEDPKFWVKRAVDSATGERKFIKLTFFVSFETSIGGVKIRCFRNPDKEGKILGLVKNHPSFMHGEAYLDEKGNVVRVLNVVHGPNFLNYMGRYKMRYEDYFQQVLPGILKKNSAGL